jgi:hypothetical protein
VWLFWSEGHAASDPSRVALPQRWNIGVALAAAMEHRCRSRLAAEAGPRALWCWGDFCYLSGGARRATPQVTQESGGTSGERPAGTSTRRLAFPGNPGHRLTRVAAVRTHSPLVIRNLARQLPRQGGSCMLVRCGRDRAWQARSGSSANRQDTAPVTHLVRRGRQACRWRTRRPGSPGRPFRLGS